MKDVLSVIADGGFRPQPSMAPISPARGGAERGAHQEEISFWNATEMPIGYDFDAGAAIAGGRERAHKL